MVEWGSSREYYKPVSPEPSAYLDPDEDSPEAAIVDEGDGDDLPIPEEPDDQPLVAEIAEVADVDEPEPIVEVTDVRLPLEPESELLADALTSMGERAAWAVVRTLADFVAPSTGFLVDIVHVAVRISSVVKALDSARGFEFAVPVTPPGFDLTVGLSTRLGEVRGASVPLHLSVSLARDHVPLLGRPEVEPLADSPLQLRLDQAVDGDDLTVLMTYPHGFGEQLHRAPWSDLVAHATEVATTPADHAAVRDVVVVDAAHQQARWVRLDGGQPEFDLAIDFSLDLDRSAPLAPTVATRSNAETATDSAASDADALAQPEAQAAREAPDSLEGEPPPKEARAVGQPFFATTVFRRAGRPDARTLAVFWFPADPQPAGDLLDCTLELGSAAATGNHLVVGVDPRFAGGSRIRERLAAQRPEVVIHESLSGTLDAAGRLFAELLDPMHGWSG